MVKILRNWRAYPILSLLKKQVSEFACRLPGCVPSELSVLTWWSCATMSAACGIELNTQHTYPLLMLYMYKHLKVVMWMWWHASFLASIMFPYLFCGRILLLVSNNFQDFFDFLKIILLLFVVEPAPAITNDFFFSMLYFRIYPTDTRQSFPRWAGDGGIPPQARKIPKFPPPPQKRKSPHWITKILRFVQFLAFFEILSFLSDFRRFLTIKDIFQGFSCRGMGGGVPISEKLYPSWPLLGILSCGIWLLILPPAMSRWQWWLSIKFVFCEHIMIKKNEFTLGPWPFSDLEVLRFLTQ